MVIGAPSRELRLRSTIDIDLPNHLREGDKIVRVLLSQPGKPVAATHMTGSPDAERRPAIVQGDLRDRQENVVAHRLEGDNLREDHRYDPRAHDVGNSPFGGG